VRKWLIILGLFVLILAGGGLAAWLARGSILQSVLKSSCNDRNLACEVETVDFELDQIVLTGLTVDDLNGAPIATGRIRVDLSWPSLFSPDITGVTIDDDPVLNVSFDGQDISFGSLQLKDLTGSGGGGTGTIPPITVESLDLTVRTPAGNLLGQVSGQGEWPTQGQLSITLTPTELAQDGHQLSLAAGTVDISLAEDRVNGAVDLRVTQARLYDRDAQDIHLLGTLTDGDQPFIEWSLSADRLAEMARFEAVDINSSGRLDLFRRPSQTDRTWLDLIAHVDASLQAGSAQILDYRVEKLSTLAEAERSTPDDRFDLASEIIFTDGQTPFGSLQSGSLTFDGEFDPDIASLRGQGGGLATNIAASSDMAAMIKSLIPATPPFSAHGQQLREASARAISGFSVGGDFSLSFGTQTPLTLAIMGPVALKAESGANILLTPTDETSPIILRENSIEMVGLASMSGGGFPSAAANLRRLIVSPGKTQVQAGGLELQSWTAEDVTLSAALTSLEIDYATSSGLQLQGDGEIGIDGPITGVSLQAGRLFGSLSAAHGPSGWRAQTYNNPCIGIEFNTIALPGDIQIGETALRLCPPDGRLLSIVGGDPIGTLNLGQATFPITGKALQADLELIGGVLDWRAGPNLDIAISAEELHLPATIDGRSLRIDSSDPQLQLTLSDTPSIAAQLNQTHLSGALVPARIDLAGLRLDSQITESGFDGTAIGSGVRISDIREDPLYEPLTGTFEARFRNAEMTLSGPLQLAGTGTHAADVEAQIDLRRLNGTASVRTPLLIFQENGLQPRDLTDRVRGLLTNARGSLQAQANFNIVSGKLSGTSRFTVTDLGFDTLRLGPVDGVNGRLYFDDIVGITTPPGQTVTIGRIDPGVVLTDGELQFQILEGQQARLEAAEWPFAGGRLFVEPTLWTIAGTTDTINVKAEQIELSDLVEALNVPDLQAEGTISGTFPIELRSGNTYIRQARFAVDEKGGTLRYTGSALNSVGGGNEIVSDAFRALQDLQYTVLELGLDGNLLGEISLQVLLLGKNPDVLSGAEFEFDVTIDSKLAQLLQAGQRATSSEWLAEAVATQVREGSSPQE
jgi:hypothetical protein